MKTFFVVYLTLVLLPAVATAQMKTSESLTEKQASHFAALALKCVSREFPNKPEHVINSASEVSSPRVLHPAFYGCYDWHSSVHGHWMLVRLLKMFPNLPESAQIRAALGANLTAENIRAEVAYMKQPNRQSFERTYGWAWALKLAEELPESHSLPHFVRIGEGFSTPGFHFSPLLSTYPHRHGNSTRQMALLQGFWGLFLDPFRRHSPFW